MRRLSPFLVLFAFAAGSAPASAQVPESSAGAKESAWSIEPRGRLQVDVVDVSAPEGVEGDFGTKGEFRRAYLGVDGTLPGNFGFRLEADFAGESVLLTDAYLTYKPAKELTFTLGQQKPFFGLEEQTSDLFTSMLERAAFTSGFGFERRLGFSGVYSKGDWLAQVGVFTVNAADLDADKDSVGFDGRLVFSPRLGPGELHLGGSMHWRDLDETTGSVRYRTRPFAHTTDARLVDTGAIAASGERSFGAELAYIAGPFHATLEGHRVTARRPDLPDPSFDGGYAEVGMLITPGDTTAYKGGVYDRIQPVRPVTEGGPGAIQLNARYDRLDLTDMDIRGGLQQTLGVSAVWALTRSIRLQANYGHMWVSDAAIPAQAGPDYTADTVGLRAQFDF